MKKYIKMHNIYKYGELSAKAKENVKDFLREGREPYIFTDMVENDLYSLFGENELKVQYSLSYCQGDGLNIYGLINAKSIIDYLERTNEHLTEKEKRTILFYQEYSLDIELLCNRCYTYSIADRLEFTNNWICELEYQHFRGINKELLYKFENIVRDIFSKLNRQYENMGYNFFYEISEEEVQEECESNDYWFTSDGKLFVV